MRGWVTTRDGPQGRRYIARWRVNGREHSKSFDRKGDADAFLVHTTGRVQRGDWRPGAKVPVEDVLVEWIAHLQMRGAKGTIKPSTLASYESIVATELLPSFGDLRADRFDPGAVVEWEKSCADRMKRGELARKTWNNIVSVARTWAKWARKEGALRTNPFEDLERARPQRIERDFLERHEIAELLRGTEGPLHVLLHLAVFTGLRRGELTALRWSDIEGLGQRSGAILVRRAWSLKELTEPKTSSSIRRVDIAEPTLRLLSDHQQECPPIGRDRYLFRWDETFRPKAQDRKRERQGHDRGDPWMPDYASSLAEQLEVGGRRIGLHTLRHSYASLLIAQGESLQYVSRQLGHSRIQLTVDLYGHLFREDRTTSMRRLSGSIDSVLSARRRKPDTDREHAAQVAGA